MSDSGPGRREVAYRLFAAEFDDAEFSYSESDEERAPNFVVTPTGARVNRLFAVGVLTEIEDVNPEMVRGRVVDPTGAFVTYAGQYQPDALAFLERADPPTFLALSGKARTFEPEDGDRIYSSVRPESVSEVDAETRDRWVVTTAERTLERIGIMASAIDSGLEGDRLREALRDAGVDPRLADGVTLALEHYDTSPAYLDALRATALDAVRVVAGERDEVGRLEVTPAEGMGDASELATLELSTPEPKEPNESASATGDGERSEPTPDPDAGETKTTATVESESESESESELEPEATDATETAEEQAAETAPPAADPEGTTSGEVPAESETSTASTDIEAEPVADTADESEPSEEIKEELDDFDPGEFELDEEERREVEEEYGTEFSTADEVEDAGIETQTPEPESETASTDDTETATDEASEVESEAEPESETEQQESTDGEDTLEDTAAESETEAIELEDAVMETMEELDDGDGTAREELVSAVADRSGASSEDIEDAIEDALMSGRCYEPSDGVFKSI